MSDGREQGRGGQGRDDLEREDRDWQRLDKWLWCARMMKARSDCVRMVEQGMLRINRQATGKPHARLRIGDVLTFSLRGRVLVLEVLSLAARRGPASEARLLYREIKERNDGVEATDPCGSGQRTAYRPPDNTPTRSPR